jgi:hypothetical protein
MHYTVRYSSQPAISSGQKTRLRIRICIIFGSRIRIRISIRVKSWIRMLKMEAWRLKMEPWRVCGLVVADSHHFEKELDPDPH